MGSDRVTPTEPRKPFRARLETQRAAPAPPGAGNRQPIPRVDLDETLQEGHGPVVPIIGTSKTQQKPTFRKPSQPPRDEPPTSAEYGQARIELGETREALEQAQAEADRLRNELRAERRKSRPEVESEAPASNGDRALGKGVRVVAGYLISLVLAGGAGAGGITLARPAASPEQADRASAEIKALRTELADLRDRLDQERRARDRQAEFNDSVASWVSRLAEQQQIRARQPESAPPPVSITPERMPGDRVRGAPLWRADADLPKPP